jgi:hypothetical protein
LYEAISKTPARTAAGAAAQLRLFVQLWECVEELCEEHPPSVVHRDPEEALLHNVLKTLEQLAANAE